MIFNRLITDPHKVVNEVREAIDEQKLLLLTYLNQHCYNVYCSNNEYRKLLDTIFTVYQADQGVYLSLKYLFGLKVKKIDATKMNQQLLDELILRKISIAIVGGDFDEKFFTAKCNDKKINMVCYQNGFFTEKHSEYIIKELGAVNASVFIIGMGVPKQELFAQKLAESLNNKIIICVGNFLEFYFGTKKRAPVFIQKIGFEWLFRLFTEPRRLWNRYLIGIPLFFFRILKLKYSKNSF